MANLQVKDINDDLYRALKLRARRSRRSIGQEVIKIIEEYLNQPEEYKVETTRQFLSLSWKGSRNETADEIISDIRKSRRDSTRFRDQKNVFD